MTSTTVDMTAILDCGHHPTADDYSFTTGSATDATTGATSCYPCAEEQERVAFLASDRFTAYVSMSGRDLTTWTGGLLARAIPGTAGVSRSGWHGSAIYSWRFRAPDGSEWYGRNAGTGMVITVRRARRSS